MSVMEVVNLGKHFLIHFFIFSFSNFLFDKLSFIISFAKLLLLSI